jgi:hypothetical protein
MQVAGRRAGRCNNDDNKDDDNSRLSWGGGVEAGIEQRVCLNVAGQKAQGGAAGTAIEGPP